jgi:hypothetical protein
MTSPSKSRLGVRAISGVILLLGALTFAGSLGWRGARFPGFFLMPNRVVPSAGLAHWSGAQEGRAPYQQVLLAVDGDPVTTAAEGYERAAAREVGTPVHYTFVRDGRQETQTFELRVFTDSDFFGTFGMYFVTGLAFLLLGVLAGERWRDDPMCRGIAAFAWVSAVFSFTALDLYGPGRFFWLHALAEAFLPATAAHLALTTPRPRVERLSGALAAAYGLCLALAVVYETFLHDPRAYTTVHNACQGLASVPVLLFAVFLGLSLTEPVSAFDRLGVRLLFGGTIMGIVMPGAVFALSSVSGGLVPVHVAGWVGFVFPLACMAALRRAARTA